VYILEPQCPNDGSAAAPARAAARRASGPALPARVSALRASIAWRAEELTRLVEEGAPRQQIDSISRGIDDLQAKLHIHEIRLREADPRPEK
jgi:hypothetical protein